MEVYYSLRVTIRKKKFSLIDHPGQIVVKKKRSKFGSNDNSECGLSLIICILYLRGVKESHLVYWKTCECLFPGRQIIKMVLGPRFTRISKNGISLWCSNSMVNSILLWRLFKYCKKLISKVFVVKHDGKSVINVPKPKWRTWLPNFQRPKILYLPVLLLC